MACRPVEEIVGKTVTRVEPEYEDDGDEYVVIRFDDGSRLYADNPTYYSEV